ncbi:MAG: hypothetical protein JW788_04420 [Candidatus Omnitrophica bacterium]|nr:hypothetical protein [Candidatus Omnitrophota bacterium]
MYPCIRPTDKLRVELKRTEDIQIGEVALYRRNNHLFAHRTIKKGNENGAPFIVTRPDNAKGRDDGPSFDEDIIGVVTAAERGGRLVSVEKRPYSALKKFYLKAFFALHKSKWILAVVWLYIEAFVLQSFLFRKAFRILFPVPKSMQFSVQMPLNNNIDSLFNTDISFRELFSSMCRQNEDKIKKWTLTVKAGTETTASLSFILKPKSCLYPGWWLAQVKIHPLFWGSRLEEGLVRKSDELLKAFGVSLIFASVFKKDFLSRMLFKRLGFKESPVYKNRLTSPMVLERRIAA